jgi:hypothetical protein
MEDALAKALADEQARRETMQIIEIIRSHGGEKTFLQIAGCMLMHPAEDDNRQAV